eukprot:CAMPEP_0196659324 /NCGR_PEP_ID=MMETSP1086-20130531/34368_1 /TAXON_ID=77921 /ORGANISM="Cyanoptyche  gloeocystis , Strain SAG4.97" /LENGTH=46 /DNA_ID= /DNA_START= /DNA_END= /DNA_ORIENTATION=
MEASSHRERDGGAHQGRLHGAQAAVGVSPEGPAVDASLGHTAAVAT